MSCLLFILIIGSVFTGYLKVKTVLSQSGSPPPPPPKRD